MTDLFKLGMELVKDIPSPELHEKYFGISGVYARLVFGTRMEKGYTQQQLANLADVGVKTIHRIEGGSGGITDKTLDKVFSVLGITHDDIGEAFKQTQDDVEEALKKNSINRKKLVKA
ncbi:helix-turn-helix domain-containing protein [Peribacillus frigoritolerans]|uniref:helix-turn-helix domain-containing protein n=1 Tax=Peribacillus frigoritolerans TaxID=450367 RepID=UPI003F7F2710